MGLWLAAPAARELANDATATDGLRRALARRGLETVTLNGFPYRGFQEPVVKQRVYHPDWSEPERLDYTVDCAAVLARLLPDDAARGSVSTLPLAWRAPWDAERHRAALDNLDRLSEALEGIEARTGRSVRVGLEPEPGCVVETTAEAAERLAGVDPNRIGVSLDLCHLAVGFEDPDAALARIAGRACRHQGAGRRPPCTPTTRPTPRPGAPWPSSTRCGSCTRCADGIRTGR